MNLNINVPNITKAEDAFGRVEFYVDIDEIRMIIREDELVGWYRPSECNA